MTKLDYKSAGVDIAAGNALVSRIKKMTQNNADINLLAGIGGFGALYALPEGYRQPILVSSTDGVGTKLKLAIELDAHDGIGIDLVAMCVNDILVSGAKPLFFLDYFATGHLNVQQGAQIIQSIVMGCEQANISLIGGETAEMPGLYQDNDYDLAGFCVGIVEKNDIIDGHKILPGHKILGLQSSGPHANGYSLIRKILDTQKISLATPFEDSTLGHTLLQPTKIYVNSILKLREQIPIHGLAHITGGGLTENIPRILPPQVKAKLYREQWQWPSIMQWIQVNGNIADSNMYQTFNCGIGMIICLPEAHVSQAITILEQYGETVAVIGEIVDASAQAEPVVIV